LEWYCHQKAEEIGRFKLFNSTIPTKPYISEQMEADLLDSFETIKVLTSILGYPLLEEVLQTKNTKDTYYCKAKGIVARGQLVDDGFFVFAGSEMAPKEVKSVKLWTKNIRNRLVINNIVVKKANKFIFAKDYLFNSPSTAAGVILGSSSNGWKTWKDKNGLTIDELKRK